MGILVNADDFGKSSDINEAIDLSFSKGLINRTTLMVNMPAAGEAMDLAREKGYAGKVGIHLNLTQGRPLTKEMAIDPCLCDSDGFFSAEFARNLKTRFFLPRTSRKNVRREIKAQLDKYEELGGSLWHIDSHHHVHTDLSVWWQLRKVMKNYPVSSVRLGRNMYHGGNALMRLYKILLNSSIRKYCSNQADLFGSKHDFNVYMDKLSSEEKKNLLENSNIEIMVHPMFDEKGELLCE